jgi:Fe-S cluster biogenesis protein NfuA
MAEPAAPAGLPDEEVRERVARLDDLLDRLERLPGPASDMAMEAVEALTEVYGTALARVVALAAAGSATPGSLAADGVVGHLLLLHGLHPDPPEQRIARALDEVRMQLGDRGDVELTGIDDGVAKLRVTAAGCASTAAATAAAVRDVVLAAAPELADAEPVTARPPALIPVDSLLRRPVRR